MINNSRRLIEVRHMAKTKHSRDAWKEIIESLVLETEPPLRYIKDAVIVTKNGTTYKLSPEDFKILVDKEKMLSSEQSEIQHCSLSIDFPRIKRDVNKWANEFIETIETEVGLEIQMLAKAAKPKRVRKPTVIKGKKTRGKID